MKKKWVKKSFAPYNKLSVEHCPSCDLYFKSTENIIIAEQHEARKSRKFIGPSNLAADWDVTWIKSKEPYNAQKVIIIKKIAKRIKRGEDDMRMC